MKPHPIDLHVGERLRLRRLMVSVFEDELGSMVGVTPHQIRKYECGTHRIGASQLYRLGQALDVPVSYFFDGLPLDVRIPETGFAPAPDLLTRRETLELVSRYYQIKDETVRQAIFLIVRN